MTKARQSDTSQADDDEAIKQQVRLPPSVQPQRCRRCFDRTCFPVATHITPVNVKIFMRHRRETDNTHTPTRIHIHIHTHDCSLLSGSLSLEALLIGARCKKSYIKV